MVRETDADSRVSVQTSVAALENDSGYSHKITYLVSGILIVCGLALVMYPTAVYVRGGEAETYSGRHIKGGIDKEAVAQHSYMLKREAEIKRLRGG